MEFVNDTGSNVYGDSPDFDFLNAEDRVTARIQVQNTLNFETPVPRGASSAGTDQFFIGADFEGGLIVALGSEYFSEAGRWGNCITGCVLNDLQLGIGILPLNEVNTYATFAPSAIPVPAAVWLFGSGLLGLIGVARRKRFDSSDI